jgi:hypothetical protein
MGDEMKIRTILVIVCLMIPSLSHANRERYYYDYKSCPVGELNAIKLKIEPGPVSLLCTEFLGIGHYFNRVGIGLEFARYSEVMNNNHRLPQGTSMWEWFPVRISYIPYLMRGKYKGRDWEFIENEPFFVWHSVTPYEYAKYYVRLFMETSFRQVTRYPRFYPFVLSNGIQISYGLISIEGGYRIQPHRWKGMADRYESADQRGFTLNGPFISANITIGGILTRTEIKNAIK